jgi:hypothetical protein
MKNARLGAIALGLCAGLSAAELPKAPRAMPPDDRYKAKGDLPDW